MEITPRDGDFGGIGEMYNSWDHGLIVIIGNTVPELNQSAIAINGEYNTIEYSGESFGTIFDLKLHYNATDLDGEQGIAVYGLNIVNGFALGSEYRWYRNRSGVVTLITTLSGETTVSSYYTLKGDSWWAQIRPRDFYGDFGLSINSSPITIGNTAPQILDEQWLRSVYYTSTDLSFDYTYFDYDNDPEIQIFVEWYRNGTHFSPFDNNLIISSQNTSKGETWYARIQVWDGDSYSSWYQLPFITITNSPPTATSTIVIPSDFANTTQDLVASWIFLDDDGDLENSTAALITWYRNGIEVSSLANLQTIPAVMTNRGESWYFTIQVTDHYNYSNVYSASVIIIVNSAPSASSVQINGGSILVYTTDELVVSWVFIDPDPLDVEDLSSTLIRWYLNGELQTQYTNQSSIPTAVTVKDQVWQVVIAVRDNGGLWSMVVYSSSLLIKNSPPNTVIYTDNHPEFIVEDEELQLNISLYGSTDADGDEDRPNIWWFINGSYQPEYDNSTLIFASQIHVGEIWTYIIRPFDGTDVGVNRTSPAIHIESRPVVHSFTAIPQTDTEGHFILAVNTTDSRNTIKQVEFNLLLNHSLALPPFIQTSPENSFSTRWLYDYLLTNYAYLNTVVTISITVVTEVTYASTYEILLTQSFNFTFQDTAPPRVPNAYFVMNDDLNPTNLTFTAIIEEYGSGIGDVTLSYYFQAVNASSVASGIGASTSQTPTWNEVLMSFSLLNESTGLYIYTVTVDFLHENMDTDIFYSIATADNAGNVNSNAFDIRDYPTRVDDQRFIYQAPGLPEGVLLVAGLAIVLVFFGAIVYVKFIRKPELVGLDKELVLNNIAEV
ncbi:MAG: hypothetical protein ACXAB9_13680, partial [Candidatus Thorarchaeota archaeon]